MILVKELDRRLVGNAGHKVRFALFECPYCNNIVERQKQNGIRDLSCGCTRYLLSGKGNMKHGDSTKSATYRLLYETWNNMRDSCNRSSNQDYKYYGAKGIKVCSRWDDYNVFKHWSISNGYIIGGKLQIDRIDGNLGYSPENCRWVDAKTNQRNRDCVILDEIKAEEIRTLLSEGASLRDIAKTYQVNKETIRDIKLKRTWN